jgi:hypothetical protein
MEECEQLNLRRLEGNYLKFMVENHAELSLLEHIENCIQCREYIEKLVEIDGHSTDFGNLFHRKLNDSSSPQFTDHNDPNDFIDARIQWRKRQLIRLNESAETELEDLQKQISS